MYFDDVLIHAKDKGMNSTTNEKGTDNKKNNSSEYNHQYYMKNKEKWQDNKKGKSKYSEYTDGDRDFDDANYNEKNHIEGTDFYAFQKPDGSWCVLEEDMKWTLPAGASKEDIAKALKSVSNGNTSPKDFDKKVSSALDNVSTGKSKTTEQEFDVDAAAMDVIKGKYKNGEERKKALGEDYEMVQKRVNELMKEQKKNGSSSKSSKSSSKTEKKGKSTALERLGVKVEHSEYDEEYLAHHGILGQKWGVRRFQNPDGTRTAAGKKREREDYDDSQNDGSKRSIDGKKLAKGAAIGAGVVGAALLLGNPSTRAALAKYGKTTLDNLPGTMTKVGTKAGHAAGKVAKKVSERASKVGDAMLDAALISVGGIAVAKVNEKYADNENMSESERNKNKILRDTIGAGINTATGASKGSGNNKTWSDKTGTHVGKEISDKIGKPSNQNIDRSSKAWQDLFKDSNGNQRDADTRATIKSMANAGYDIEQIDRWLNHSAIKEWADSFCYKPKFRW